MIRRRGEAGSRQGSGNRDQGTGIRCPKGSIGGVRHLAEMAAEMVTKHAKGLNLWLRLVETRTVGAVRATFFGGREFN